MKNIPDKLASKLMYGKGKVTSMIYLPSGVIKTGVLYKGVAGHYLITPFEHIPFSDLRKITKEEQKSRVENAKMFA